MGADRYDLLVVSYAPGFSWLLLVCCHRLPYWSWHVAIEFLIGLIGASYLLTWPSLTSMVLVAASIRFLNDSDSVSEPQIGSFFDSTIASNRRIFVPRLKACPWRAVHALALLTLKSFSVVVVLTWIKVGINFTNIVF